MALKFETKCKKLGITDEVESIIANCECGEVNGAYIVELSKMRKFEIMEVIGNYLDSDESTVEWWDIKRIATFCKAFEITEDRLAEFYALGISEGAEEIAYALVSNKDVVLVLY